MPSNFEEWKQLARLCILLCQKTKPSHTKKLNHWHTNWYQSRNFPYFLLVGSDVKQSHRTVGGTAGSRSNFRGRSGLRHRGHTQSLSNRHIAQCGGEVLLHLLPLCLLDVVLGGVLQVGLYLIISRLKELLSANVLTDSLNEEHRG